MKTNSRAFVNQMLIWVLVTFCGCGTVGLGTVWMRHQISRTADNNRVLYESLRRIKRQIAETQALVESAQSLPELRHRNAEFRLGLEQITEGQVVHDSQTAGERLLAMRAKSNQELLREGLSRDGPAPASTPVITFKIAQAR